MTQRPTEMILPPDLTNEIPVPVPLRIVLAQTPDVAVWLTNVRVFSNCMTFSVEASQRAGGKFLGIHGYGEFSPGFSPPMLFGIEDSAGQVVTNRVPDIHSRLVLLGGGASNSEQAVHYCLLPLPATGVMTFHVAWPHFGIEESRFEIDTAMLHEAAANVVMLWPDSEHERLTVDMDDHTDPAIEIPTGGWFADQEAKRKPRRRIPPDPRRVNFGFIS